MPWALTGQASLAQQATSMLWQCQSMKKPDETQVKLLGVRIWNSISFWSLGRGGHCDRPVDSIDPQRVHVADRAVVDAVDHFLPRLRVSPHEADTDLEVLLLGQFGGLHPAPHGRSVGRKRLLREDVDTLLHGVFEIHRAKGGVGRQQHDIAGPQAVDRLLVGVEPDELSFRRARPTCCGKLSLERIETPLQAIVEQIGHRVQLDRATLRRPTRWPPHRCLVRHSRPAPA